MKKTPLHQWHCDQGANMGEFASYEMPLWYPTGAKAEHLTVMHSAGLFDTSHMAVLTITGPTARTLLQYCFSKDLEQCIGKNKTALVAGRSVYGVFLNEMGCVIDDAIISQFTENHYMLVVNAGMGASIAAHLEKHIKPEHDVTINDFSDKVGKVDIQGPAAGKILARILKDAQSIFTKMIYFSFKGTFDGQHLPEQTEVTLKDGTPLMVSRTGYTGEFGFELFIAPQHLESLWKQLLEAGDPEGLLPCGLAARDSLRSGAVLPLSHQDIGDWPFANNPWLFVLPLTDEGFSKQFVGSKTIEQLSEQPWTFPFAGYDLRKIPMSDESRVTDLEGQEIGIVLTCTTDMAIERQGEEIIGGALTDIKPKGLCCGFLQVKKQLQPGDKVYLVNGKRKLKVEIRSDIRPNRTARKPIKEMISAND